jgi:hypothetical protein
MESVTAEAAARPLLDLCQKPTNEYFGFSDLDDYGFPELTSRRNSATATAAINPLYDALARGIDPVDTYQVEALIFLADRLDPAPTANLARSLLSGFTHNEVSRVYAWRARVLAALAPRLGASLSAEAAQVLLEALRREKDASAVGAMVEALVALADQMDQAARERLAAEVAPSLFAALGRPTDPLGKWVDLARPAEALASRMDASVGSRFAVAAGQPFLDALIRKDYPTDRHLLAKAVAALAGRLDDKAATQQAAKIIDALEGETSPGTRSALAKAVAVLASRVGRQAGERLVRDASRPLIAAIEREKDGAKLVYLAEAVAELTEQMDHATAAEAVKPILSALVRPETGIDTRAILLRGVSALARRMDATTAAEAARPLLAALERETNPSTRSKMAGAVSTLAMRMDAATANDSARLLLGPLGRETDETARSDLTKALASLAGRIDTTIPARQLILTDLGTSSSQEQTAQALTTLVNGLGPSETVTRSSLAAGAVAALADGPASFAGLLSLAEAARPLPVRLTEQQLVDLLKMPTCVGPVRTAVLDLLGQKCGRRFTGLWDFVDWAEQNRPDLDLRSPPQRPNG